MTNAYRGETPLRLGPKDNPGAQKTYTLRFTTMVRARIESALQVEGWSLIQKLVMGGVNAMLATFHAALTTPLERGATAALPNLTLDDLGFLIDDSGGPEDAALRQSYWLLLVNAGIIDRQHAEDNDLIPKSKDPKGDAASEPSTPKMRLASGNAGA